MLHNYRPRREIDPARFESHREQQWYWCPTCKIAVPQLSPEHYKGECHCEKARTGKPVEMVLLVDSDSRVAQATEWLRR